MDETRTKYVQKLRSKSSNIARTFGRDSYKRNLRDCSETMSSASLLQRRHVGLRSLFFRSWCRCSSELAAMIIFTLSMIPLTVPVKYGTFSLVLVLVPYRFILKGMQPYEQLRFVFDNFMRNHIDGTMFLQPCLPFLIQISIFSLKGCAHFYKSIKKANRGMLFQIKAKWEEILNGTVTFDHMKTCFRLCNKTSEGTYLRYIQFKILHNRLVT